MDINLMMEVNLIAVAIYTIASIVIYAITKELSPTTAGLNTITAVNAINLIACGPCAAAAAAVTATAIISMAVYDVLSIYLDYLESEKKYR